MSGLGPFNRREMLAAAAGAGLAAVGNAAAAAEPAPAAAPPGKVYKIGLISASIRGQTQKTNGHTWHFAQGFHPQYNLDAVKKYLDPGSSREFERHFRNPKTNFDRLPFAETVISHYYDADPKSSAMFAEAFPGVQVAMSLEEMVKEVDAIWLGDASGYGDDHFDLIAPGLEKGLPTFCDKPIGASVAGTRKILDFAKSHNAPLMSSSIFRHQWGMEQALRMRDSGEFGRLEFVLASMAGGYTESGWVIYGHHPIYSVITLCGPGVQAVSLYARENAAHALMTYPDRMPAEVWYGRPDLVGNYCETLVHFAKKKYYFTPSIEGDFWYGHHYEIYRMAATFLEMVKTRVEPVPHQEILEVTAVLHAGIKSRNERSRLVDLAEVLSEA